MPKVAVYRAEDLLSHPIPVWKRILDVLGGVALLVALAPLLMVIAVYIKIASPGPVFFKQERVGRGGRLFTMWKFRTMDVDNDTSAHRDYMASLINGEENEGASMVKLDHSISKIIPLGSVLRKTAIDELPQLFNVVAGDMSLVGPRPPIPYEVERYQAWHRQRFDVLPGMTGLWQVSGKNRLTFNEMVRLDIRYARSVTPVSDFRILARTPFALAQEIGGGARESAPSSAKKSTQGSA